MDDYRALSDTDGIVADKSDSSLKVTSMLMVNIIVNTHTGVSIIYWSEVQ